MKSKSEKKGSQIWSCRKAQAVDFLLISIIFIIAFAAFFVMSVQYNLKIERKVIGEEETKLLMTGSFGQGLLLYIDESAKHALGQAIHDFGQDGGFYKPECGTYIGFTVWDFDRPECRPVSVIDKELSRFFNREMDLWVSKHPALSGYTDMYELYLTGRMAAYGIADTDIVLGASSFSAGVGKPGSDSTINSYLGTQCSDNSCIADIAAYFTSQYKDLPYVWGGESPYTYEETKSDQLTNEESIFKGVSVTEVQPAGNKRSGLPTVPGFDCSGFYWWVMRHAGVLKERLTAAAYLDYARSRGWRPVCDGPQCTRQFISENAMPGDTVFIGKNSIGHIAIYLGNGEIAESAGSVGVERRKIPNSYYPGGRSPIAAIYRPAITNKGAVSGPSLQPAAAAPQPAASQPAEAFDDPADGTSLEYRLRPSFTVYADFDPDEFAEKAINKAVLLKAATGGCTESACVKKAVEDSGLKCSSDASAYHFLEGLSKCTASKDTDCVCRFGLEDAFNQDEKAKTYEIMLQKEGSGMVVSFKSVDFSLPGGFFWKEPPKSGLGDFFSDPTASMPESQNTADKPVFIKLKYGDAGLEKGGVFQKEMNFAGLMLGKKANIYIEQGKFSLVSESFAVGKKECSTDELDIYYLCAESSYRTMSHDGISLSMHPVAYRFAMELKPLASAAP